MNYKRLLTLATITGLAVGALAVASAASAQSYGGGETTESTVETDAAGEGAPVLIQDTPAEDSEADGEETDGKRRGHRRGGCNLEAAADAIGIDEADLRGAIENGETIADVATANGVDAQAVIDAMVSAKADRIEAKVDSGRITAEQAADKLAELESRTSDRVNGVEDTAGA